jgi:hypothetical protein
MNKLMSIKAGDHVWVGSGKAHSLRPVERTTRTTIVLDHGHSFSRDTGVSRGVRSPAMITGVATAKEIKAAEQKRAAEEKRAAKELEAIRQNDAEREELAPLFAGTQTFINGNIFTHKWDLTLHQLSTAQVQAVAAALKSAK